MYNSTRLALLFLFLANFLISKAQNNQFVKSIQQDSTKADINLPHKKEEMRKTLLRGRQFLIASNNDSTQVLITKLLEELSAQQLLDTPLGLEARLLQAEAIERSNKNEEALPKFLKLIDEVQERELWELFAAAHLSVAVLYEKTRQSDGCMNSLMIAKTAIKVHQLDSLFPKLAVRASSYHRFYGDRDSSLYYAKEAIRTGPNFNNLQVEADANLLMGMLLSDTRPKESMKYYARAGKRYLDAGNYASYSHIMTNLSKSYLHRIKDTTMALQYNDSSILIARKAIELGHLDHALLYRALKYRGEIYQKLGIIDSAVYYTNRGNTVQTKSTNESNLRKILEIEAQYNDEKKAMQIAEQERERKWLLGLIAIVGISMSILVYYYFQLRKANQKTREQALELKQIDIAKSQFFANVSHELRTPLSLMIGPIHTLLKENQLTSRQVYLLKMADKNGQHLKQLINEILDLQKLELSKLERKDVPTILLPFFLKYASQFESLAAYKAINYVYHIHIDEDAIARIDQEKCRQILYNLLSNAFKYTPNGKKIELIVEVKGSKLQILVKDNGPGIHPHDLPHLFKRYFQTNRPEKAIEGGTGIGLAICKAYTDLFNGQIEVESTVGAGATFTASFPISISPERAPELEAEIMEGLYPSQASNTIKSPSHKLQNQSKLVVSAKENKPKILVVEDNPDLQSYISMVLSSYDVFIADHGQAAIDCITHTPDIQLVLSDLMMPVMDGYQLLEHLKSTDSTRHIPVVMLTARADINDKLHALRIGVDDYLLKPFNEEELLVRIENLLQNQAVRQAIVANEATINESRPIISAPERDWLESFELYVKKHLTSDILSVPQLADKFAMSESTLLRQLKRLTGLSPKQYLQEVRLNEARQLLENRTLDSISAVARHVGYRDRRSFSRSFKKRFQKLPTEV